MLTATNQAGERLSESANAPSGSVSGSRSLTFNGPAAHALSLLRPQVLTLAHWRRVLQLVPIRMYLLGCELSMLRQVMVSRRIMLRWTALKFVLLPLLQKVCYVLLLLLFSEPFSMEKRRSIVNVGRQ